MSSAIPDRPIANPDGDELGRSTFANAIADLILGGAPGATLRIGIYGGWGEGKTSVLRLIETKLRRESQHVIWLTPWTVKSREQLLDELLFKLASELRVDTKNLTAARRAVGHAQGFRDIARADMKWRRHVAVNMKRLDRLRTRDTLVSSIDHLRSLGLRKFHAR